jgi:hypothetical protein
MMRNCTIGRLVVCWFIKFALGQGAVIQTMCTVIG